MVLSKSELISALQHEVHILLHLCTKVQPSMLDYRPTPKQRSTIELLRYLSMMGPALIPSIKAGEFDVDLWTAEEQAAASLDFDAVVKKIEGQKAQYADLINGFSEEDLRGEINLFGSAGSRGLNLVTIVLNGYAAYRTQLFCYLKACGREELNTMNLWAGADGSM